MSSVFAMAISTWDENGRSSFTRVDSMVGLMGHMPRRNSFFWLLNQCFSDSLAYTGLSGICALDVKMHKKFQQEHVRFFSHIWH